MATTNNQALHWILGASLLLIIVFVVGALLLAQSEAATGQVTITNALPTFVADPIISLNSQGVEAYAGSKAAISNLNAGGDRTVYIYGKVEDNNGQDDFQSLEYVLKKTGTTCSQSDIDLNDCYYNSAVNDGVGTCSFTDDANPLRKAFECSVNLASWMDATGADSGADSAQSWVLEVTVGDGGTPVTNSNRTFEVTSLSSLSIPASIDFGTMAHNTSTATATRPAGTIQTLTQQGNVANDVKVSMSQSEFGCSASTAGISRANLHWSLSDVDYNNADTAITNTAVDTNIAVAKQLTATATTKALYWNLFVPYGVEGTCTSTITMTSFNANL